jgi:hypothetical protein
MASEKSDFANGYWVPLGRIDGEGQQTRFCGELDPPLRGSQKSRLRYVEICETPSHRVRLNDSAKCV